jgi:hypothetical protein
LINLFEKKLQIRNTISGEKIKFPGLIGIIFRDDEIFRISKKSDAPRDPKISSIPEKNEQNFLIYLEEIIVGKLK